MMRLAVPALLVATLVAAISAGEQEQQPPRFAAGVDLVQVDVSVLDRDGNPVRGLTAGDFTLLENGRPQEIRACLPIEFPPPVRPTASWLREIGPDVVANAQTDRRFVIILMDDATTTADEGQPRLARLVARAAVDQLGPSDLAAVVFTWLGRTQNFTADRRELFAAIDSFTPRPAQLGSSVAGPPLGCSTRRGGCLVSALEGIGTFLKTAPPGRKLLIYIGSTPDVRISTDTPSDAGPVSDMLKVLHDANVEINAFDAAGLRTFAATATDRSSGDASMRIGATKDAHRNLQALADATGGRAVANTNEPGGRVSDVFRRNSVYYLLGFQPSDANARGFRSIEVKVNRADVEVRSRRSYYAPGREADKKPAPPIVEAALAHGLAARDLPIQVNAAILATPGRRHATVFVTAGLRQSSDFGAERVTLGVVALDSALKVQGRQQQTFDIPARPTEYGTVLYDVHSRLSLRPGRYELRVAVESRGRLGSVIKSVDVPDFSRTALALSNVLLERLPAIAIKNAATADVLPIVPTSAREFTAADRVSLFVSLYQDAKKPAVPVTLETRIVDASNTVAFQDRAMLTPDRFATDAAAHHRLQIPLEKLRPGDYLLQVEATAGAATAARDARFSVRR